MIDLLERARIVVSIAGIDDVEPFAAFRLQEDDAPLCERIGLRLGHIISGGETVAMRRGAAAETTAARQRENENQHKPNSPFESSPFGGRKRKPGLALAQVLGFRRWGVCIR